MAKYLQHLSGFFFYLLGASFFLAYLFIKNLTGAPWPQWWLSIADLPLALVAILYGGTSLYLSITPPTVPSRLHTLIIAIPLTALFAFLIILNFWEVFA